MFDSSVPGPEALAAADDAAVVTAIEGWARVAAAADARRLAAIAELTRRRCPEHPDPDDERPRWICDPWDACAAEISAALHTGSRRASGQMYLAVTLRERLPRLGALYLDGHISARIVSTVNWRTHLILDTEVLALIDTALAAQASTWGPLSDTKLDHAIDSCILRYDPDALVPMQLSISNRDVRIGDYRDEDTATTAIWGRLLGSDAALLKRRLTQMTQDVCDKDPRTIAQRRADALGALAVGTDRLTCTCGRPDCPAAGTDPRARAITVHILTDQHPDAAPPPTGPPPAGPPPAEPEEPVPAGPPPAEPEEPVPGGPVSEEPPSVEPSPVEPVGPVSEEPPSVEPSPVEPVGPVPEGRDGSGRLSSRTVPKSSATTAAPVSAPIASIRPDRHRRACSPGLILGGGIVPAPLLAELIRGGATVRTLRPPGPEPEPGYRPSTALVEFVRCRDVTCRFPGCNQPAEVCDLDHTIAWPLGPTHPSNVKCLCRKHHLLKTFWTGPGGWTDRQLPDGTINWTAPTGRVYTTHPGTRIVRPDWDPTTVALPPQFAPAGSPNGAGRTLMMPTRRRTRANDRIQHIKTQRNDNAKRRRAPATDQPEEPPPAGRPIPATADPPPF